MNRRRHHRALTTALRILGSVIAAALVIALSFAGVMLVTGAPLDEDWAGVAVVIATIVGAAAWPWARRGVDHSVARVIHGAPRSPEDVLRAFQHSGRDTPVDELLVEVAEALIRTMQVATVGIWLHGDGPSLQRRVSIPHRDPSLVALDPSALRVLSSGGVVGRAWLDMWCPQLVLDGRAGGGDDPIPRTADRSSDDLRCVPATHAGELLALVVLVRETGADRFGPRDDAELGELGSRLGLVLHNRRLDAALQDTLEDLRQTNAELRASRVRLVATADAARRRLERNLHDGAQQHLVALAVDLRLAADEIAIDPTRAPALFSALGDGVREAIAELRSLAHGIYPPLLVDEGLVEALRVRARRSPSPVTVTTDPDRPVGRYAPEIEAAAYFCCMEALQNAAKHAPGARVEVSITESSGTLRMVIEDHGPGFDPSSASAGAGHGLGNMADRIGAIGGTLSIDTASSGGVRILASVPVDGR